MLRRAMVSVLVALALVLIAVPVGAQVLPTIGATVLTDGLQIYYPGASSTECFDLGAGVLQIESTSPPGRTGETATLEFVRAADGVDLPYLRTIISDPERAVAIQYTIEAGRYCYTIAVTKRLVDTGDPNRPERPTKQVYLRLTHAPFTR